MNAVKVNLIQIAEFATYDQLVERKALFFNHWEPCQILFLDTQGNFCETVEDFEKAWEEGWYPIKACTKVTASGT